MDTFLTLTGGDLPPETSCTFSLTLDVPATTGIHTNTTSDVTGDIGGSGVTGSPASDKLFVESAPVLTKSFTDDPVGAGGTVTLEFTITNPSAITGLMDITFEDIFDPVLPTASTVPADGSCGALSTFTFTPLLNPPGPDPDFVIPASFTLSGGSLAAASMMGDSCTFSITLDVAVGAEAGTYPNTTGVITAAEDSEDPVTGNPATDNLVIVAAPSLLKEFTDDPADPGGTVTLEFTLSHDVDAPGDATGITFTDDLAALVPSIAGLTATGLPLSNLCGPGNGTLTGSAGDTFLTFSGATLTPGEVCTFSVTLSVPGSATPGNHTNTTSDVSATVLSVTAAGNPASDDLRIASLTLTKEFTDDPVLPGGTVNLRFTLDNASATDATGIGFTDDLALVLPGTPDLSVVTTLPMSACGGTLDAVGITLGFSGGSVSGSTSCSFDVTLMVPAGTADDSYINTTSGVLSSLGTGDPATDALIVDSNLLDITKEFTDDPVMPGGTVNLRFTITNLDASNTVTDITFADDLDAALMGLVATGLPMATCGGTVSGTDTISLTGGSLGLGASCMFDVSVMVPSGVLLGTVATNTTGQVTGMIGPLGVTGGIASDDLVINNLTFTKAFDGPTTATGTPVLTFTITNLDAINPVNGISFSDDLDTVISGLEATGLPMAACGGTLSGTGTISLMGGDLGPGGSCSFDVNLLVPSTASAGSFLNTTSDLQVDGLSASTPASATLTVELPPLLSVLDFSKEFTDDPVAPGGTVTLEFTIENMDQVNTASNLSFTDDLNAVIAGLAATNLPMSDICGMGSQLSGTTDLTFSGGTLAPGASCTFGAILQVPTSAQPGTYVNTTSVLTGVLGMGGMSVMSRSVSGPPLAPPGVAQAPLVIIPPVLETIPTLNEWGLLFLLLSLLLVGMHMTRRVGTQE